MSTTIVSFLPVFTLEAAEGKLFGPLAYTKTFALVAALIITLFLMPAFAHWLFGFRESTENRRAFLSVSLLALGAIALAWVTWGGATLVALGIHGLLSHWISKGAVGSSAFWAWFEAHRDDVRVGVLTPAVSWLLADAWQPLGIANSQVLNFPFVLLIIGLVLGVFKVFIAQYPRLLQWALAHELTFLAIPVLIVLLGANIWMGADRIFGFVPGAFDRVGENLRTRPGWPRKACSDRL